MDCWAAGLRTNSNYKRVSLGMLAVWLIETKISKKIQKIVTEIQKERSNGKALEAKSDWFFRELHKC